MARWDVRHDVRSHGGKAGEFGCRDLTAYRFQCEECELDKYNATRKRPMDPSQQYNLAEENYAELTQGLLG